MYLLPQKELTIISFNLTKRMKKKQNIKQNNHVLQRFYRFIVNFGHRNIIHPQNQINYE